MKLNIAFGIFVCILLASCAQYVKQLTKQSPPNVLLICIDDLRPELKCYGADYIESPHIDALAKKGILFNKHFVNAPSCGPSRYTLLTGQYGTAVNNALFLRAEKIVKKESVDPSMPEWFKDHGYTTVSVGKVSHHPGGRGGADWDDNSIIEMPNAWDKHLMPSAEWEHPRGMMHGLANGEIRVKSGEMDVYQAVSGDDDIYPDGIIANEAVTQLRALTDDQQKPFFMAVGFIRPHLPFGAPKAYLDIYDKVELPISNYPQKPAGKTTWHQSGEFMKYNRWDRNPNEDMEFAAEIRRHYAACVSYADAQVGKLLDELKKSGKDKNTIVVLWGDHGWHLGEHAIWGKHSLFEESLHSPMIIYAPSMKQTGIQTEAIVETLDLFPTLCDLAGITQPDFVQGVSLDEVLRDPNLNGHPAIAYTRGASTIRTMTHRMTLHKDGFVELYDHTSEGKETINIAIENPAIVKTLEQILIDRLGSDI